MSNLVTRVIAAGVLTAVFSVYGDSSNLMFYADFNAADNQQPMDTSGDLNDATDPSLRVGVWSLTADHTAKASVFATGEASQGTVLYLQLNSKNSGSVVGTLSEPAGYRGQNSVRFSFDFKPSSQGVGLGYKHLVTGRDSKFLPIFYIELSNDPNDTFAVKVNGVLIGSAFRSSNSALKLNNLTLTVTAAGISATLINGSTLAVSPPVNNIPLANGAADAFSRFSIDANVAKNVASDYDNFICTQILKTTPPPRLDLYLLTTP